MALSFVQTACLKGTEVVGIKVEVDIQPGLPYFTIIGLPDKQIGEAKERVRLAIKNSGYKFPKGKVTVNLTPASLAKTGTSYDLPIALGILSSSRVVSPLSEHVWVFGELSLNGEVVGGSSLVKFLVEASKHQIKGCVISQEVYSEAQLVGSCPVVVVCTLKEVVDKLASKVEFHLPGSLEEIVLPNPDSYDVDAIYGQSEAKRALEIAIAGNHPLFLSGPPGCGKSMLAKSSEQLLPQLNRRELLELGQMYQLASKRYDFSFQRRPFISPHFSISFKGLFGGGNPVASGSLSLAHRGVLFLDEFLEMDRRVREGLRQPLEEKEIRFRKAGKDFIYPANCLLIAASNPCKCGQGSSEEGICTCTPVEIMSYQKRLSNALADRFDLFCSMTRMPSSKWRNYKGNIGQEMKDRIQKCKNFQVKMYGETGEPTEQDLKLDKEVVLYLQRYSEKLFLSMRGMEKVGRVARTIADLAGREEIVLPDVQEALQYRRPATI